MQIILIFHLLMGQLSVSVWVNPDWELGCLMELSGFSFFDKASDVAF